MFRNTFLLFITAIILSFLLLSSCNETSILENKTTNTDEVSLLKGTKKEVKIIGYETIVENGKKKKVPIYDGDPNGGNDPKALPCDYYFTYPSKLDRYEPKSGKNLCIWNLKPQLKSANELHDTWGFSGYYVGSDAQRIEMENLGYDPNNIMVGIGVNLNNGNYTIPNGSFKKYYIR